MKKRKVTETEDDLRPDYAPEFFRKMKPNRFASAKIVRKQQLAGAKRSSKRVASKRRN